MAIVIRGIGILGGFGYGINTLEQALKTGKCLPTPVFIDAVDGTVNTHGFLADTSPLTQFIPAPALRRIDHPIKMALLGCFLALKDADMLEKRDHPIGIIVATGYGSTCNRFDFSDPSSSEKDLCYSPTKFSNSVHNAAAAYISVFLKEHGPNLSINHFDMSIPSAFITAAQWLNEKRVESVLVGGFDEYSKVMAYFGQKTKNRFWVGEGSIFFLLTHSHGTSSAYAQIQDIQMGNLNNGSIRIPENTAVILNVDGYDETNQLYEQHISENARIESYVDLYGNFPVGMGFDIAIGALSIKRKKLYKCSMNSLDKLFPAKMLNHPELLPLNQLCCLKLSATYEFGVVTLSCANNPGQDAALHIEDSKSNHGQHHKAVGKSSALRYKT